MKIMSKDELEKAKGIFERARFGFTLGGVSERSESELYSLVDSLYDHIIELYDFRLTEPFQLSQAVELLGGLLNATDDTCHKSVLFVPYCDWRYPSSSKRCASCYTIGLSGDQIPHKPNCPIGRAQAFLKEVKG